MLNMQPLVENVDDLEKLKTTVPMPSVCLSIVRIRYHHQHRTLMRTGLIGARFRNLHGNVIHGFKPSQYVKIWSWRDRPWM